MRAPRLILGAAILACARTAPAPAPAATPEVAPTVAPIPAPGPDLTKPPALGPAPTLALPPVVSRTLANGLRLLVVEQHELPVADFVLQVGTGYEADPPSHAGLAGFTANMLDEGTTTRTSLQIADQSAYLGIDIGAGAGWDASRISLHTPTAQLDSALALFADVALRPAFPERELERIRKERLTALVQFKDEPTQIANVVYAATVFGAGHPYGHPVAGTERSVKRITRDDIQRFHRTYYRPNNATLIVVGDVRPDDVERRANALFGGWEPADVPKITLDAPPAAAATTVYLVDKPGAAQSSFRLGGIGAARTTDDYFALLVMNTILGGSFTSRLNQNLRETKGYTYGAGSRFDFRRTAGPFTASAEVVAAKTDSALVEFLKELRAIRDTVPAAELEKAKRYVQLRLPAIFETTQGIAAQLALVALYGLPLDYYNSYVQRIEAVTQADVQRVAQRYVDPAKLAIVIVGDRKAIEPGLRAVGAGPVVLRDIWGQPIP
ncbi:MAG: M16 family metallopeptidase [Gemmatimonadaceae bacterium]